MIEHFRGSAVVLIFLTTLLLPTETQANVGQCRLSCLRNFRLYELDCRTMANDAASCLRDANAYYDECMSDCQKAHAPAAAGQPTASDSMRVERPDEPASEETSRGDDEAQPTTGERAD